MSNPARLPAPEPDRGEREDWLPALSLRGAGELGTALAERFAGRVTARISVPAREARYADFPETLEPRLKEALRGRGIERLWSHQREAWDHVEAGRDLVVVTPTASGKTLCYNLPVLDAVLKRGAKALYLFPTKALAQDQVAEISALNRAPGLGVRASTFDGDTPADARRAVRTHGDIVVSNPDMLHQAILPHHTKWAQFFESLAFVVIDEVHHYRGVFGSHVANVIRRLKRIAAFYGVSPRFILCSATIGNPREHAEALLGGPVAAVTSSGAPSGEKHLLLWNPPVVNPELGIRASARSQSTRIARAAIAAGLKAIVFARSRLEVEVLTKYLKDAFDHDPRRPARVHAYRGGYLPEERRATECKLREGAIDCVISTSALELGVDIGMLDVAVLNGYPGSIAATWQRLGRAGRRQQASLGVLVASSEALDQYVVRHPEFFVDSPPECARIDADQLLILHDHVRCAAFELPFRAGESFGGRDPTPFLAVLAEDGVVHRDGDAWHWIADSYPANAVNLRGVADGNFVVVDLTDGGKTVIAEVDYGSAALTLYENAIYMVQSRPWQVERLDWAGRKAFVTRTEADYYTDAIDYQKVKVLEAFEADASGRGECAHGEIHHVRRVTGYKKIRYYTHENIGYGKVDLPDQEMHTTSVWWRLPGDALDRAFDSRWEALDGFLGAAHALHTVAAVRAMCEPLDLGRAVGSGQGDWHAVAEPGRRGGIRDAADRELDPATLARFEPTVFLYDNHPGGSGLAAPLYRARDGLLADATLLVHDCACARGCPACIGPVLEHDEQRGRDAKRAALRVLALLADGTGPDAPAVVEAR
jgi:DEAD/DEAH box helicase domain-containing protein